MNKVLLILASVVILQVVCSSPPFWGGNQRYTVKVDMHRYNNTANWTFMYYYDWSNKGERDEHDGNQNNQVCHLPESVPFNQTHTPCIVTFARDGWLYIEYPAQNYCCKCTNSFGAVRYDWLQ